MITVGLTGGIGSGKTYVASLFEKLGIAIYNADAQAKHLMNAPGALRDAITEHFGHNAYTHNQLNRSQIAQIVFNNPDELKWLNAQVHPAVNQHFNEWANSQKGLYVIKEAAILIESGSYKQCNELILVIAPEAMRIKRVMERDNLSETEVRHRISNQHTDEEKMKFASFFITNDGKKTLEAQIEAIHKLILTKYNTTL